MREFLSIWTLEDYIIVLFICSIQVIIILDLSTHFTRVLCEVEFLFEVRENIVACIVLALWGIFLFVDDKYGLVLNFFSVRQYIDIKHELLRFDIINYSLNVYIILLLGITVFNISYALKKKLSIIKWIVLSVILHWSSVFYIQKNVKDNSEDRCNP